MKRILSALLAIALVFSIMPVAPVTVKAASQSDLTFELNTDGVSYRISDCKETASGTLTIPATYKGKPVTVIGNSAFFYCSQLTEVLVPETVVTIEANAFSYCSQLVRISIPENVTQISEGTFSGCSKLTNVVFSNSVTSIGNYAFSNCAELSSFIMPTGIMTIGDGAFYYCRNLSKVHFPDSVTNGTSIGRQAFYACKGLNSIHIPEGVSVIGDLAFESCANLTSVTLPASLTSIGVDIFEDCAKLNSLQMSEDNEKHSLDSNGVLFNKDKTALISALSKNISGAYSIPDSVISIGGRAFYGCNALTGITIPEGVVSVGDYAFGSCGNLNSAILPASLASIGIGIFDDCGKLSNVQMSEHNDNYCLDSRGVLYSKDKTELICALSKNLGGSYSIPNGVTSIGDHAFRNCIRLTGVAMPESVTDIGNLAFYNCTGLTSIVIPKNVTDVGVRAFAFCNNLTSITIPDSITNIGEEAFDHCTSLSYNNYDGAKYLGNDDNPYLVMANVYTNNTTQKIHDRTKIIMDRVFNTCTKLTSITISSNVIKIGNYAFSQCSNLSSIVLPSSLLAIDNYVFDSCNALCYVWYAGSENDRNSIAINVGNDHLLNANWHYNCCNPEKHAYDNSCDDACNACGYLRSVPEHIYTNDCDVSCNECGSIRSIIHVFDHDCDAICNICGYVRSVSDHTYTNSCDNTCNICGCTRDTSHVYDDADDLTCNVCKQALAPDRPTMESVTETSVTLVAFDGYEYKSTAKANWQKSNVFTGLEPGTLYVFYQRVAESADSLVGPASQPLHIWTTKYTPITPDEPIVESKTSTTITLKAYSGYEYSIDGETWQVDNLFSGLSPETQYTFYQRIAETRQGFASASSQPITVTTLRTFTVVYNSNGGTSSPDAQTKDEGIALMLTEAVPERKNYLFKGWSNSPYGDVAYEPGGNYTEDKDITLYAVWVGHCYDCGSEGHTFVTCSLCDGTGEWWGNISTCCYARTAYIAITHGQGGYLCLDCGKVCAVEYGSASCDKTMKRSCQSCSGAGYRKTIPPAAPQPELLSATLSSIAVVAQFGMEYSIDGVTWQTSNVFEDLLPNTQYTVYQRYEENDYYNAGQTSEALSVSTLTNYTVVFKDWDGTILSANTYQYGDAVTAPANPTKATDHIASYTFAGWDNEVVNCTGNATYTATYNATYIDYTVVFKNWNGTVLSTETYHWGDAVTTPANPSRPSDDTYIYTFAGWDKIVIACCGNAEYTAVYSSQTRVPSTITSSIYTVSSTTISKITAGTTVSAFLSGFNEGSYCKVYKGNTEVSGSTAVGTGMIVKIMDGNTVKASYTIIVTGDTNGDGNITVTDMIAIKAHVLKKSTLSGVYATAADTNGDNGISITDFIQVKAKILEKGTITAR